MICSIFFFKQNTAYELSISDWSSDVCSSDLNEPRRCFAPLLGRDSDDLSFCDTRILDQLIFKIDGVYVEPSRNDHIFCPADQFDETILIDQIGRASSRERVCQYV